MTHFLMKNVLLMNFFLLVFLGNLTAQATAPAKNDFKPDFNPDFDVSELGYLKVHEGGRVKPLDSYAEKVLLIINGKKSFQDQPAIHWLAKALFTPQDVLDDKIFKTTFKEVLFALGIEPDKGRRYSFNQLTRAVQPLFSLANEAIRKEEEDRSAFDKEVIRLYQNFLLFRQVLNSFVFTQPIEKFLIENPKSRNLLGLANDREMFSYFEILLKRETFSQKINQINSKDQNSLKAEEIVLLSLYKEFTSFPSAFLEEPLKIFPTISGGEQKWFSAWEIFFVHSQVKNQNLIFKKLENLNNLTKAYQAKDQAKFSANLASFNEFVEATMQEESLLKGFIFRTKAEVFYNRLDPFYLATIFYGLSFLTILLYFLLNRKVLKTISWFSLLIAFLFNSLGLGIRVIISHRPPITNLFETFIFVAFIIVLFGFFLERYNKAGIGILSSAICGLVLLMISNRFISDGDTLAVLVAVLRSNFWLSTHVIAINLGYGGIVLSGVIAHLYLFKLLQKNPDKNGLKNIVRMVYASQGFGIIFTFLGTMLGGIWADQSWGRFWGWDPKENGALLIILWSSIVFHARLGGIVRDLGFIAGSIVGIPVVMLAWFGINLLGIGLHSYGFISGVAYGLVAYLLGQFLLLFVLLYIIEYRRQKPSTKKT